MWCSRASAAMPRDRRGDDAVIAAAVAEVVRAPGGDRHRRRQRRRDEQDQLRHLHRRAPLRIRRRHARASRARTWSSSRDCCASWPSAARTAKYRRPRCVGQVRPSIPAPLETDIAQPEGGSAAAAAYGGVHECGLPGRHRVLPAERLLPHAGRLSGGGRRGDAQRIRGDRAGRHHPADRRAGSGDGPAHHVPRPHAGGVRRPSPRGTSRC